MSWLINNQLQEKPYEILVWLFIESLLPADFTDSHLKNSEKFFVSTVADKIWGQTITQLGQK